MTPATKGGRHQGNQRRSRLAPGSKPAQPRFSHLLVLTAVVLATLLGVRLPSTLEALVTGHRPDQPTEAAAARRGDQQTAQPASATGLIEPAAGPDGATGTPQPAQDRSGDPMTMSAIEQLAAELARRGEVLARREQALAVRETAMALVEQRVREQAAQLEALKDSAATLVVQVTAEDQARTAQMSRIYEAMKPRSAAAIFEQTSLDLLLPVVRGMREAKVSAIVAAMSPDKARALTAELTRKHPMQAAE